MKSTTPVSESTSGFKRKANLEGLAPSRCLQTDVFRAVFREIQVPLW